MLVGVTKCPHASRVSMPGSPESLSQVALHTRQRRRKVRPKGALRRGKTDAATGRLDAYLLVINV